MYFLYKRLFDIAISLLLILLLFPLFFICGFFILILHFQNPIFIQERSGINGKKFNLYKLQTFKKINGEKKITFIGKILRISKIDEIPQLYNILKNDMSLIGPRPLFIEFNNFYKKKHSLRLNFKPGITGLAQVKLKSSVDWNRKFNFDYIYIKKANLNIDIYIMIKTIKLVFKYIFSKNKRPIEDVDYMKNFFQNYK